MVVPGSNFGMETGVSMCEFQLLILSYTQRVPAGADKQGNSEFKLDHNQSCSGSKSFGTT
jgi:hypothetical protein